MKAMYKSMRMPLAISTLLVSLAISTAACGDTASDTDIADTDIADTDTAPDTADTAPDAADTDTADTADTTDSADTDTRAPLPSIASALRWSPGDDPAELTPVLVQPALAFGTDHRLLVAWTGKRGDTLGIFAGLWEADDAHTAVATPRLVNTDATGLRNEPSACALAHGGYVIAWSVDLQNGTDNLRVAFRRFDATLAPLDPADVLVRTTAPEASPNHWLARVACGPEGGFAVAGVRPGTVGFEVFVQRFDDDGSLDGPPIIPIARTVGGQAFPHVGLSTEALFVAWEDTAKADADTTIAATRKVGETLTHWPNVVAARGSDAVAAFVAVDPTSGHALIGGQVGGRVQPSLDLGAAELIPTPLPESAQTATTSAAAAAYAASRFGVVWFRGSGNAVDVRYARLVDGTFSEATTVATGKFQMAYRPAIAARDGAVVLAWVESLGGGAYILKSAIFGE